jgi:hypothetical protein
MITWPAMVPVKVELCPDASKRNAEQDAGNRAAHQRVQHAVGVLDFHDLGMTALVEGGSCQHQDRGS